MRPRLTAEIVTRYPAMPRYQDARRRLAAIDRPVPTPTPEAIALNKKELASRTATTRYERFVNNMGKHPDLSAAAQGRRAHAGRSEGNGCAGAGARDQFNCEV